MSNSTNINNCSLPDSFWSSALSTIFVRTNVFLPFYVICGCFGNTLLLIAVSREAKKDRGFVYQQYIAISRLIEIFSWIFFLSSRILSGAIPGTTRSPWFVSSYICMAYTAYLNIYFVRTSEAASILLSCSQAADRAFLLINPASHHAMNKKKHQLIALFASVSIAVLTNGYMWITYYLSFDINTQQYQVNFIPDFMSVWIYKILVHSSTALRLISLLTLVTCNIIIVLRYRRRFSNKVNVAVPATDIQKQKDEQRKLAETTITLLTFCESCFFSTVVFCEILQMMVSLAVPRYETCYIFQFGPALDIIQMLASTFNFYGLLAISKQFCGMVKNVLMCKK